MKLKVLLLLFFTLSLASGSAQYFPKEREAVKWENYSRHEIRDILLNLEPESEIYQLARKSRINTRWSILFYTLGSAYSLIGLHALGKVALGEKDPLGILTYGGLYGLGAGVLNFSLGAWQSHRARKKLRRAIELYEKQHQ